MRWDWIPLSASALVVGVLALAFGALLNPVPPGGDAAETVATVSMASGRWLGMGVMYFLASVALTLGMPAVLSLFGSRGRIVGSLAVAVMSVGFIGTSGYAMLLVFFRALVLEDALRTGTIDTVADDLGLGIFLWGWVGAFYVGLFLLAVALLVARRTHLWVGVLVLVCALSLPFGALLGRAATIAQMVALAFAFTAIALTAARGVAGQVSGTSGARRSSAPAY